MSSLSPPRLSADSPFHSDLNWERDRNIRKGKIQFGRCYPGLSEAAITFMKNTLSNKAWWVHWPHLSQPGSILIIWDRQGTPKVVSLRGNWLVVLTLQQPEPTISEFFRCVSSGPDPQRLSASRSRGYGVSGPPPNTETPSCVSPPTSCRPSSRRERWNETRSAPSCKARSSNNYTSL